MKYCNACGQAIKHKKRRLDTVDVKKLISIMANNNLNPDQLSKLMGVSLRTFYRWMNGERTPTQYRWDILKLRCLK